MRDAPLAQLAGGLLHRLHVARGTQHDAHERPVHVELLELGLHLSLREIRSYRGGGCVAHQTVVLSRSASAAISLLSCIPSKEITCAAAYAAMRAERGLGPSAVTLSTRPPAVTIESSRATVPACVSSTPTGTSLSPRISSPLEDEAGKPALARTGGPGP